MKFFQQNYVRYALIMCLVIMICLIFMELSGQNKSFDKSPVFNAALFFAPVIVWYLGISHKKKMLKGIMTFQQGLSEGFKISLVYALISPFIFLFYYLAINPGILDFVRTTYGMTGASDAAVITTDSFVTFSTAIVMGTLLSAIVSFFLKSKKK